MLGKLIKYDLKSMSRAFIPIWILAPVISLMLSLSLRGTVAWADGPMDTYIASGTGMITVVMVLLFAGVMVGLTVMTILFIIQRFWNGLLKDEGYLMFTLPVEVWQLITAKGLTATLITCISVLDGVLSCAILVLASADEVILGLLSVWSYLKKDIAEIGPLFWVMMVLMIVMLIVGLAKSIYQVYAAMALGQLFESHKVIGSCVSYVGIAVVISVITSSVMMFINWILPDSWLYVTLNSREDIFGITYMILLILVSAVQIAVFHVIAERILSTRLNLE